MRQPGVGVQSLNAVGAQLTGETSGENAGHAVETADFNQDGIQDYAVGAPIVLKITMKVLCILCMAL